VLGNRAPAATTQSRDVQPVNAQRAWTERRQNEQDDRGRASDHSLSVPICKVSELRRCANARSCSPRTSGRQTEQRQQWPAERATDLVVKHVELLGRVTASVEPARVSPSPRSAHAHDRLGAAGVVVKEGGNVEDLAVDRDPDVVLGRVLLEVVEGELLGRLGLGLLRLLRRRLGRGRSSRGLLGRGRGRGRGLGALAAELERDLAGGRVVLDDGLEVAGDLAETLGSDLAGRGLREEVGGSRRAGDTAVDDAAEQGRAAETVRAADGSETRAADQTHWTPPPISPHAKRPGMGLLPLPTTSEWGVMWRPPMV